MDILLNRRVRVYGHPRHPGINRVPLRRPLKLSAHWKYGGDGFIAGEGEGIVTVGGVPAPRRILLLERERLKVIDDQWSAADGTYLFAELNTGQDFIVLALDHKRQYEPVAYDYVRPVEDTP